MTHRPLQSHHANLPPVWREPDPTKVRKLAEDAWHGEGDDPLIIVRKSWLDRSLHTLVDGIGTAAHGKRRVRR